MGILDGKVAIVTGAGLGLGRVEALELARHGARVVVNDLGVNLKGEGGSEEPARAVVAEIEAAGGEARAAFGDVADWQDARRIVRSAVSEFGGLDIVVNNAGIQRDGMIVTMDEAQFDSVMRVHTKGHFTMIKHTMDYWRERSTPLRRSTSGRWWLGSPRRTPRRFPASSSRFGGGTFASMGRRSRSSITRTSSPGRWTSCRPCSAPSSPAASPSRTASPCR